MNQQVAPFVGPDFEGYLIVQENRSFGRPDAALCRRVQAANGLTNLKVLYDPDGALDGLGAGQRHHHWVLTEGAVIEHVQGFRDDTWAPVVERLLR